MKAVKYLLAVPSGPVMVIAITFTIYDFTVAGAIGTAPIVSGLAVNEVRKGKW